MTRLNIATEAYVDAETTRAGVAETALALTTVRLSWGSGPPPNFLSGLGTFAGPGSQNLIIGGMLPGLVAVGASGTVIDNMTLTVSGIPVRNDDVLDFGIYITVTDLAAVNKLTINGGHSNVTAATDYTTPLDESTLSLTTVGSDLSIAAGAVSSTAGGVFLITYSFSVGWD